MPLKHWWYQWAEKIRPAGYQFFRQPPALLKSPVKTAESAEDACGVHWIINPLCENIGGQAKGAKYWLDQVPGKHTSWIEVNLCAEYGQSLDGKVVYPEFEESRHVAREDLKPIHGLPITLGFEYDMHNHSDYAAGPVTGSGRMLFIYGDAAICSRSTKASSRF
jgi:hypothetical protein